MWIRKALVDTMMPDDQTKLELTQLVEELMPDSTSLSRLKDAGSLGLFSTHVI